MKLNWDSISRRFEEPASEYRRSGPRAGDRRLRVNIISESQFNVKSHGVHTAFEEAAHALHARPELEVMINAPPWLHVDVVHVHTVGPFALLALKQRRALRIITTHLTPDSLDGSLAGAKYYARLTRAYLRHFYGMGDALVAVSSTSAQELEDLGLQRSTIHILPNSIDMKQVGTSKRRADLRRELGFDERRLVAISVGQLQPRKGISEFVALARTHPDILFVWVGSILFGPASAAHRKMHALARIQLPNLRFMGSVPRARVFDLLSAADIYISTSLHETFGLSTLEAAASGLPLVLTDLPVFRETYGPSAQYGPPGQLAGALNDVARNAMLRASIGRQVREVALKFDSARQAELLVSIYRSLLLRHEVGSRLLSNTHQLKIR
jgi:1,2-diacylglycerol-3-alpha-glucose alpha-1,2-galactosyltransferase